MENERKKTPVIWLVIVLGLAAVLCGVGAAGYFFGIHRSVTPAAIEETVEEAEPEREYKTINIEVKSARGVPVVHHYAQDDSPRRPGEIREIRYITIHETDNRSRGSNALAHNVFLTRNDLDITGWHYTVDDHVIYHHIPDNEIAWNAGDNRDIDGGNMNGVGIELCVNIDGDYQQTMANGAALTAELLWVYDLSVDDVRLHSDFMNKVCPHRMITEGLVDDFLRMVKDNYEEIRLENEALQPVESE